MNWSLLEAVRGPNAVRYDEYANWWYQLCIDNIDSTYPPFACLDGWMFVMLKDCRMRIEHDFWHRWLDVLALCLSLYNKIKKKCLSQSTQLQTVSASRSWSKFHPIHCSFTTGPKHAPWKSFLARFTRNATSSIGPWANKFGSHNKQRMWESEVKACKIDGWVDTWGPNYLELLERWFEIKIRMMCDCETTEAR